MVHKVTTALFLDTRNTKKNNRNPIKLRITYQRKRKYYATGFDASPKEWEMINSDMAKGKLRTLRTKIDAMLKSADEFILNMPFFSFIKFEGSFFDINQGPKNHNVFEAYDAYITQLELEGRLGNQSCFSCSKNSLKSFKNNLEFEEITSEFLKNYESWMLSKGKSLTTVGFYLRALRTIINKAINDGIMLREDYPFGMHKYVIPGGKKEKRHLTWMIYQKFITFKRYR